MVLCPDTVLNLDCAEYQVRRLDIAILGTWQLKNLVLVMLTTVRSIDVSEAVIDVKRGRSMMLCYATHLDV